MEQPQFDLEAGDPGSQSQWELTFNAPLAPPKERNAERVPIAMTAALRQRGAAQVSVGILDLSTHGFRIDTHLNMPVGTAIWLRLPSLEAVPAKIVWVHGHCAGCAFDRPLHPAVLEMIVRRSGGSA